MKKYFLSIILLLICVNIFSQTVDEEIPIEFLILEEIEIKGTAREPLVVNIAATAKIDFSSFLISRSFSDEILNQIFVSRSQLGQLGQYTHTHIYSKTGALIGGISSVAGGYLLLNKEKSGTIVLSIGGGVLVISGILYLLGK